MNTYIIGVGSNINPKLNIEKARNILKNEQGFIKESAFIKTKPVGFLNQSDFLNGAFLIRSNLPCDMMRSYLKSIEKRIGRIKTSNKNGPRTIDLDIIVHNGTIIDDDYHSREFLKNSVQELL